MRACVFVNNMDKNLSGANPHEFMLFCNFPIASMENERKIFATAQVLYLDYIHSEDTKQSDNERNKN